MVDDRRDTSVRVVLRMRFGLVLALLEVEVDRLVRQAKLLQHSGDFPAANSSHQILGEQSRRTHQPLGPRLCVKRVNCFPWDILSDDSEEGRYGVRALYLYPYPASNCCVNATCAVVPRYQ